MDRSKLLSYAVRQALIFMFNTPEDKARLLDDFLSHRYDAYFRKHYGAYMLPIFAQAYFAVNIAPKYSPLAMPHGLFFQNWTMEREFDWMWRVEEMQKVRNELFASLERDISFGKKFFASYQEQFQLFDMAAREEEKKNYQKMSPSAIVKSVLALIEMGSRQGLGYVVDSLLTFEEDDWFPFYLSKYLENTPEVSLLASLREPTYRTFVSSYHLALLEVACTKDMRDIQDIVRRYYWVENNYLKSIPKTADEVLQEISEIRNPSESLVQEKRRFEKIRTDREHLFTSLHASPLARAFVEFADDSAYIQDCRKQVVLRLNHFIFSAVDALAEKLSFDRELLLSVMFFELEELIGNPEKFRSIAAERQKGCLSLFDKDGCAIVTRNELQFHDLSMFYKDYSGITEAKGTPASPGKKQGIARVILGSDQFHQFESGNILVTNQTTPDFVPLMKKAVAIVAEQGGVTSHAAVLSREFGIPCIVGVKDAMQIFTDGEMVEVDAHMGVVRKV